LILKNQTFQRMLKNRLDPMTLKYQSILSYQMFLKI
jgi:hypothetical protein